MSSDVIDALNATKTLMDGLAPAGVTALKNVYVYPNEYKSVRADAKSLPFLIVAEAVGRSSSIGDVPTPGNVRGLHSWAIELIFYLSKGENKWPGPGAATAELQHKNWAIAVNDMLARNQTLSGTVFSIGEKRGNTFIYADYLIDHEQWDQEPYWSIRFLIPVVQLYDRGG